MQIGYHWQSRVANQLELAVANQLTTRIRF